MTMTYGSVLKRHEIEIPAHLEEDAEVPVLTGLQRQGDVLVVPAKSDPPCGLQSVPPEGIAVVRGEAGGNTHLLVAYAGEVRFAPQAAGVELGTLDVKEGAVAMLLHPEHGAQGIGAGTYSLRRQREMADEIRTVAD